MPEEEVRQRKGDAGDSALVNLGKEKDEFVAGDRIDIRGDERNVALLLVLYLLQGIPLGLSAAIPMILVNKGVSFKQQAEFSMANWPFSLKLLWAPLVDSVYVNSFGRRKTWLVPAQYLIGGILVLLSTRVDAWMQSSEPQVALLTAVFFAVNFLGATQDIAVDGWALTMLRRRNKPLASTCNSVGQTTGFFLGYVVFIALESEHFVNSYLRVSPQQGGMVTFSGFLYFWGVVYLVVTTLVAVFKRETADPPQTEAPSQAALQSYKTLIRIIKLPSILRLAAVLLTVKLGFAACDGLTALKLVENGVPRETLALLAVPLVPLEILLPVFIAKYSTPNRPVDLFLKVIPYRLAFNLVAAVFVFMTPSIVTNGISTFYYLFLLAVLALHQVTMLAMFVQAMAFFALVSDPGAGGTYMTLLNTLSNLGSSWSTTAALWAVDGLTFKSCVGDPTNDCSTPDLVQECELTMNSKCSTWLDGYYIETLLCTFLGFVWLRWGRRTLNSLQNQPLSAWAISPR